MSLYSDSRQIVAYALKKGWLRYPGTTSDEIVPMPEMKFYRTQPKEIIKSRQCRKCQFVWYDGSRACPKCLGEQFTIFQPVP